MPRIWQALVDQELHAFFGRGDHAFEQGAGVSVELKLCDPVGICQHVDDTGADFVQLGHGVQREADAQEDDQPAIQGP
ncbi:MAG: hypothetical protein IPO30_03525 [Hyphomonadaceae bacterium]|nr:hypothetical protein [Hyphomonadaceae bacterium]MBP9233532.1 hypothetical protein [Hyphomonadaceae bacterium]